MRHLIYAILKERQNHNCKPGDDDCKYIENELKNDEGFKHFIGSQRSKAIIKRTFNG